MQSKSTQRFTEVSVRNFGPIIECELELRPLTVFVGPSNTGKSYVAALLYALHSSFNYQSSRNRINVFEAEQLFKDYFGKSADEKLKEVKSSLQSSLSEFDELRSQKKRSDLFMLRDPAIHAMRTIFDGNNDNLKKELERCFGTSIQNLVRYRSRGSSSISVSSGATYQNDELVEFSYDLKQNTITSSCPEQLPLPIDGRNISPYLRQGLDNSSRDVDPDILGGDMGFWYMFEDLLRWTEQLIVSSFVWPAHYFPADRTGLLDAHSVLVGSLIERAATSGLLPAVNTPLLTGIVADFLEKLIVRKPIRLRGDDPPTSSQVADAIEEQVIGGTIQKEIEELTGYPRFQFLPNHWKQALPLVNSSSMVSELAPVIMFLRDHVHTHHFIILEEPESHLHPAKQVEFTRLLAKLIDHKVRVVLITHSEWVIEELGNIVSRATVSGGLAQEDENTKIAIPPNQVGVWLFYPKTRNKRVIGSQVKEIKLDESGFYPTDYDNVARELHNDWLEAHEELI